MNPRRFVSKYLRAEDFKGKGDVPATISSVETDQIRNSKTDQMEDKLLIYFNELDRPLIGNPTNVSMLIELFGDETNDWINKKVTLYHDPNVFFGTERKGGLRVRGV
jgi:hypothetical protein